MDFSIKRAKDLVASHPAFFDLGHVRDQLDEGSRLSDAALLDRLLDPENPSPENPNIIFDCATFRIGARHTGSAQNPILSYLRDGDRSGSWPNALFSPTYYRSQIRGNLAGKTLVEHALENMHDGVLCCHPMIDAAFLAQSLNRMPDAAFFKHLFSAGFPALSPHRLVDIDFVSEQEDRAFDSLKAFFKHYHHGEKDLSTHILFDAEYYRSQLGVEDEAFRSVYHYLSSPIPADPHPLVDAEFYRGQLNANHGLTANRALEHFLEYGQALGVDTSPFFSTRHYETVSGVQNAHLQDYLRGGFRLYSPHGLVNLAAFSRLHPQAERTRMDPASLLACDAEACPIDATPLFDAAYYVHSTGQKELSGDGARKRYFRSDLLKGALPNSFLSADYIKSQTGPPRGGNADIADYLDRCLHHRPRLLLVFEALEETMPVSSWLTFLQWVAASGNLETIVVTRRGGVLFHEFKRVAHLFCIEHFAGEPLQPETVGRRFAKLCTMLSDNLPVLSICCIRDSLELFLTVKTHLPGCEAFLEPSANRLPDTALQELSHLSACPLSAAPPDFETTAPVQVQSGIMCHPLHEKKEQQRGARRQTAMSSLGIDAEMQLVVGSGPLDLQSGVDLFASLAIRSLTAEKAPGKVHFLWCGSGPDHPNSPLFYAQHRFRVAGLSDHFQVVDPAHLAQCLDLADVYVQFSDNQDVVPHVFRAIEADTAVLLGADNRVADMFAAPDGLMRLDETDLDDAARTLNELLVNDDERRRRTGRSRQMLRNEYGPATMASRLATLFHWVDFGTIAGDVPARPRHCFLVDGQSETAFVEHGAQPDDVVIVIGSEPEDLHESVYGPYGSFAADDLRWMDMLNHHRRLCLCRNLVVCGALPSLEQDLLDGWDDSTWFVDGSDSELEHIYRFGLYFDRIVVASPTAIDAMAGRSPRIAAKMTHRAAGV